MSAVPANAPNLAAASTTDELRQPQYGFTAMNWSSGQVGAMRSHAAAMASATDAGAGVELMIVVTRGSDRETARPQFG